MTRSKGISVNAGISMLDLLACALGATLVLSSASTREPPAPTRETVIKLTVLDIDASHVALGAFVTIAGVRYAVDPARPSSSRVRLLDTADDQSASLLIESIERAEIRVEVFLHDEHGALDLTRPLTVRVAVDEDPDAATCSLGRMNRWRARCL